MYQDKNQTYNSRNYTVRLSDEKDKDLFTRFAFEDNLSEFIKTCVREHIAREKHLELIRDEGRIFTVYSPRRNLTFILHNGDKEIELIGMCQGELIKEFAEKYAGQFNIKKESSSA